MSRRVRELLSIHNIGQRLFAKYVLGLSQGTVSELLSKPKSWDKLTEKGRDSYRKMHAWCYDENAIMLLKSLIPRKGELVRQMSSSPLVLHCKYLLQFSSVPPVQLGGKTIIIFPPTTMAAWHSNLHTSGLYINLRDNTCLSEVSTHIISCHWRGLEDHLKCVSHNCRE